VKGVLYLVVVALVALMIFVPTAIAQEITAVQEETVVMEKDLAKAGGPAVGSVLLPAAALLVGTGVLAYAVLRHR
jgi:hypothetical protein